MLKRLQPTALEVGKLDGLQEDYERVAALSSNRRAQIRWSKAVPFAVAWCLLITALALYQFDVFSSSGGKAASPEIAVRQSAPESGNPASLSDNFVPVSTNGTLIKTSSGGIVETENGPREKMQLQFEDSYHWVDPETGTNIRFFYPRSEEVIVPLPAR